MAKLDLGQARVDGAGPHSFTPACASASPIAAVTLQSGEDAAEGAHFQVVPRRLGQQIAQGEAVGLGARLGPMDAAVAGLATLGVAAEIAARKSSGPGSFQVALTDALYALDGATLAQNARVS